MRTRTAVGMLVGVLAVLVFATPAAAQESKVYFSGGYQYFRFIGYSTGELPAGWGASIAVGKERVKFVFDVGGQYKAASSYTVTIGGNVYEFPISRQQQHMFQGGVEFSGPERRVIPFARLLTGAALLTNGTSAIFVFTPEAGAKIMVSDSLGAQLSVGLPIMASFDGSANGFRFFAGIVFRK